MTIIGSGGAAAGDSVAVVAVEDRVRVEIAGTLFTEYHYGEAARPFFYPVIGPTGMNVTRHWPMREAPDEEQDHRHHRGLWFTHGEVNGQDFWSEGAGPRIEQVGEPVAESGLLHGVLRTRNHWCAADGSVVCTDTRTHRFFRAADGSVIIDFEIELAASEGDVVFGDTKEGSMAIRLAPTLRQRGKVGRGYIVNSEGVRDGDTWGKRAAWCDYYGPLGDAVVGVAIFDHPANPRHPTWWHVRDYGLFAANPFGLHWFENKRQAAGDLRVAAGDACCFRYRVLLHEGDTDVADVAAAYAVYAGA